MHPCVGAAWSHSPCNLLEQYRGIESGTSGVGFLEFGPSSLEIEVSAYVFARNWSAFFELQQGLLLRIKDCIDSAGAQIALPSQTVFLTSAAASEGDGAGVLLPAATADKKVGGKVFAAKAT